MKLLCLYSILKKYTDEEHGLTIRELAQLLEETYGIACERKTLYKDIAALKDFGVDILTIKSHDTRYYMGSQDFELAELKVLVDLVQNSKFITKKKSDELIAKIERLTSVEKAKLLQKQVRMSESLKTANEQIYYNVDKLHRAIISANKIEFLYCQWRLNYGHLERVVKCYRKNGEKYKVSPFGLVWNDDNYYLVAYDESSEKIKHYRVDKMEHIEILKERRCGMSEFLKLDFPAYKKQVFGMFGGTPQSVKIRFDNKLVGVVADRFGRDVAITRHDENSFDAAVNVALSGQFFGWVFGFGTDARIIAPEKTVNLYREYLESVLKLYEVKD